MLLVAGLTWFASTAFPAADLASRLGFAHRGLVIHALLVAALSPWPRPWLRICRLAAIVLAYISSIGAERPLSASWTSAAGVAAVAVLLVAVVFRQAPSRLASLASVGIATWTLAAGVARVQEWGGADSRLQWYCVGFVLSAATVGLLARRPPGAEPTLGEADIVRDGGRADLRVGYRDPLAAEFYDADGRRWTTSTDESVVRIDLGEPYGEAIVARRAGALDPAEVQRQMCEGLRLLATNRRALRETRLYASEVSASQARIRAADERAASEVALELNRDVVRRLDAALAVLASDNSDVARGTRIALTEVIDEVVEFVEGLSPRVLAAGLPSALTALAADQFVPVTVHLDNVQLDSLSSTALYFVAAECLTNASRHASASSVSVHLRDIGDRVELAILDDGAGGVYLRPGGGLAGVERRLQELGGELVVTASAEGGTAVTARLPLRVDSSLSRP
jgi:signal transduction histidine kinase